MKKINKIICAISISVASLLASISLVHAAGNQNSTTEDSVYVFKDAKKDSTVTFIKKWKDNKDNSERPVPDIEISTKEPEGMIKKYKVVFHCDSNNGLTFDDGTDTNTMVYNSKGQLLSGTYKIPKLSHIGWFTDEECTNRVILNSDGSLQTPLTGDVDLWAKELTFEVKGRTGNGDRRNNEFNYAIPENVKSIIFTDEEMPADAQPLDVDADGDDGVVAWVSDEANMVVKVSTQIPGVKVQAAKNSGHMFSYMRDLVSVDFSNFDTTGVTSLDNLFNECNSLENVDISGFDTSKVTDVRDMFGKCKKLKKLDLSDFDSSSLTTTSAMFNECTSITELDLSSFNTSKVTDMKYMFYKCSNLVSVDLSSFDTSSVTMMHYMFQECNSLVSLDLSNFNTSKVITMRRMFMNCRNLSYLNISSFDTSNVTDMSHMFYYCQKLRDIDVSSFNTSKVIYMNSMFSASSVVNLDLTSFDTSNVTNMSGMFSTCTSLVKVDLSSFNTSKVTNMENMFFLCRQMKTVDLTGFNTSKVTNMGGMFYFCRELSLLDLSSFDTSKVTTMKDMFLACLVRKLSLGDDFAFVGSDYRLRTGNWVSSSGDEFTSDGTTCTMPNNTADTYTLVS